MDVKMSAGTISRTVRMSTLRQMSLTRKTVNTSTRSENEKIAMIVSRGDIHSKMPTNLWQYEVVHQMLWVAMRYGRTLRGCTTAFHVYDVVIVSGVSDSRISRIVFLISNIPKANTKNWRKKS